MFYNTTFSLIDAGGYLIQSRLYYSTILTFTRDKLGDKTWGIKLNVSLNKITYKLFLIKRIIKTIIKIIKRIQKIVK